jgi:hypothetical protein
MLKNGGNQHTMISLPISDMTGISALLTTVATKQVLNPKFIAL